jgi:hypothetical protein
MKAKSVPEHDCEQNAREHLASERSPYRYVASGLPNVYLVGVRYWICRVCERQAAEIPALAPLLSAIARTVIEKRSPLTGAEVRFLRKRLGKRSMDFAAMIGVEPPRLSAIEGAQDRAVARGRDKLIRLIYRVLSKDKQLRKPLDKTKVFEAWITSIAGGAAECITATWLPSRQWRVEAQPQAA